MKKITLILVFLITLSGLSQNGICGGIFTDSGGVNGNYGENENQTIVICPNNPGDVLTVTFTQFNTESAFDGMYVYDGNSVSASQQISSLQANGANPALSQPGAFWGNNIPGPFTAYNPSGCLTFKFVSDSSVNKTGWIANVTCALPTIAVFRLNAFLDSNNNGIKDNNEINFTNGTFAQELNNSGNINYTTTSTGNHSIYETNINNVYNFNFQINPLYAPYYSSVLTFSNVITSIANSPILINFPITVNAAFYDVEANLNSTNTIRAGFNNYKIIAIKNLCNQTISNGTVVFTKDPNVTINTITPNANLTASGFTYDFSNLQPFATLYFYVTFSIPSIPTVSIGQLLTNSVTVTTTATEPILSNNFFTLTEAVTASYDPNDITESHGEKILFSNFNANDFLNYTIRFENTGTAFAENVNITNFLDSKIDENSIQMVASSDNCVLNRVGNNLDFKFKNIFLPVSVANSNIGKGFVTYKAKLKPGFAVGTIVPNAAKIYFDTNPAIDTNIFETEFTSLLSNSNFETNDFMKIYPNPTNSIINVKFNSNNNFNGNINIELLDIQGRILQSKNIANSQTSLDITTLDKGVYFLKINSENRIQIERILKN